jgi:hypothetical protein
LSDEPRASWDARWGEALAVWSKLLRLSPPRWCETEEDERREGLLESFAMIRSADHAVVLSARQLRSRGLERFPLEIMAHEIGHHVYCPGDLADYGRMLARMRRGLPSREQLAPMVANVYGDLLINDRLRRTAELDVPGVYRALAGDGDPGRFWTFIMRIYEHLWSLPRGSLAAAPADERLEVDAQLGARLVRAYAKDWVRGSGRFAALCYPYLDDDAERTGGMRGWADTAGLGRGAFPDGLTEIEDDEDAALHPAFDPELSGVEARPLPGAGGAGKKAARRRSREIGEYGELLRAMGVDASPAAVARRYYRERALPHLVRYPSRRAPRGTEPLPEGLQPWEPGDPLERIDWVQTLVRSPVVVPGITTVERTYGASPGPEPRRDPVDLYVGIDCSGSMPNPQLQTSYPALAGAIVSLSALRAGARVKVVLSGEPGKTLAMPEFSRDEREVLEVLTSYLGTGTGFGVKRLADTFDARTPRDHAVHVLLLSDSDLFALLDDRGSGESGWDVARRSLAAARGGGTAVLQMPAGAQAGPVAHLEADGWRVHYLSAWEDLIAFAHAFSRRAYDEHEERP